jgi:hypothetical protein
MTPYPIRFYPLLRLIVDMPAGARPTGQFLGDRAINLPALAIGLIWLACAAQIGDATAAEPAEGVKTACGNAIVTNIASGALAVVTGGTSLLLGNPVGTLCDSAVQANAPDTPPANQETSDKADKKPIASSQKKLKSKTKGASGTTADSRQQAIDAARHRDTKKAGLNSVAELGPSAATAPTSGDVKPAESAKPSNGSFLEGIPVIGGLFRDKGGAKQEPSAEPAGRNDWPSSISN